MISGMSLGPQCHSCRKRRVRCDSTTPACQKCMKAGIECPGYGKALTWIGGPKSRRKQCATPLGSTSSGERSAPSPASSRNASEAPSSSSRDDEILDIVPHDRSSIQKPMLWLYEEDLLMIESVHYFNNVICPDLTTMKTGNNIYSIDAYTWYYYPQLLRKIVVCMAQGNMVNRLEQTAASAISRARLALQYKTQVVSTLNERIANKNTHMDDLTVIAVLMVMLVEVQDCHANAWSAHLEGARQLLRLRGGFSKCLSILPGSKSLLWTYMMLDILHSTTCNPKLFATSDYLEDQTSYLEHLEDFYQNFDAISYCPCPIDVLRVIILTNIHRAEQSLSQRNKQRGKVLENTVCVNGSDTIDDLVAKLESFSAENWALGVEKRRQHNDSSTEITILPKPEEITSPLEQEKWIAIGKSYQSAAMLYLLRTLILVPTPISPPDSHSSFSGSNHSLSSQQGLALRDLAAHTLLVSLQKLVGTKFEKVMLWPLFIAGFESLFAMHHPIDRLAADATFEFSTMHLARIGEALGSAGARDGARFLLARKKIWHGHSDASDGANLASGRGHFLANEPLWDTAFASRYIFLL